MFALSYSSSFLDREKAESLLENISKNKSVSVKTSGSTGHSKELTFDMSLLKSSAQMTNTHFEFKESTVALLCLSLDTIAGKMMCVRAFEGNYNIRVDAPNLRPLKDCVTPIEFIAMVPVQLKECLLHDLDKLKNIRVILVGGGPISNELEQLLKESNITVFHSYGMTETVSHVAMRKVGADTDAYFQAMPGVEFSQENGQLVLSAQHLNIEKLHTNDIVEIKSASSFKWIGRKDFVVNSGGYKIQLEDLENRLSDFIEFPFFLWKESDEKWGERLILCHAESKEIQLEFAKMNLKNWEIPKKVIQYSNIIFSESGKILRAVTFEQKPISIHG